MTVSIRHKEQVALLDLNGKIVLGEALFEIRNAVREVLNDGYTRILMNMKGVNAIDSAGIGELVSIYTTVTSQGGTVKLVQATQRVVGLLHLTKLLTVFEAFEDEKAALNACRHPRS